MADVAAAGPADGFDLTDREGREVVLQHELLFELGGQAVDDLLVLSGAQDGDHQGLSFAAGKEGRTVCPRQDADLATDMSQFIGFASVGTNSGQYPLADDASFQVAELRGYGLPLEAGLLDLLGTDLVEDLLFQFVEGFRLGLFAGYFQTLDQLVPVLGDHGRQFGVGLWRHPGLPDPDHLGEFVLHGHDLADGLVPQFEGLHQDLVTDFLGTDFEHVDLGVGARHDDLQVAFLGLLDGRVDDKCAVEATHAHRSNGPVER